jgi:hypothetical protein
LLSCIGSHLGFRIGIKNPNFRGPSNDYSWAVWFQLSKWFQRRSGWIFNMAARANNMLWLAEISKIFFSETNELTEPKL